MQEMTAVSLGTSSGAPKKPKKGAKSTLTTRAHRFEPFSKRIARLNIDPIHRVTRDRSVEHDDTLSKSHFRASLEHWNEFNLSQNYTDFSRKVNPLCESLPQLLHHADGVLDLLEDHISRRDELALEPLLDLVAHFAQDLGQGFEKYFSRIVTLVISVAATHEAPEVIEWCFTSLTWIFKFLSRLLVPDLRPLMSILSPYLGKSRQKAFVTRFAAESIAFLVRKAAVIYPKKQDPLKLAISYLMEGLRDLVSERDVVAYQTGLMTLFSEAIKGVDGGVHSCGPDLLRCLINESALDDRSENRVAEVLEGLLINIIHQSDAKGFQPLVHILEQYASSVSATASSSMVALNARLIFVIIGTRKGSRIKHWSAVIRAVMHLATIVTELDGQTARSSQDILTTVAMTMQYAPMSELLPFVDSITLIVTNLPKALDFLSFCHFFDSIGQERFQSLFLPYLQQFIVSRWNDDEMALCLLLKTLQDRTTINSKAGMSGYIACPPVWEGCILDRCSENLRQTADDFDIQIDAYTELTRCIDFPRNRLNLKQLQQLFHNSLIHALQPGCDIIQPRHRFALGKGFEAYVQLTKKSTESNMLDPEVYALVCSGSGNAMTLLPFLHALSAYLTHALEAIDLTNNQHDAVRRQLIDNLMHADDEIRATSLLVLQQITPSSDTWATDALSTISIIQSTTYNLENIRRISMYLRKLPRTQAEGSLYPMWRKMIPYFCFGLLSKFPGQTAQEVCFAIAEMCETVVNEDVIAEIIDNWLRETPDAKNAIDDSEIMVQASVALTPFQCSNILRNREFSHDAAQLFKNPLEKVRANFEHVHQIKTNVRPPTARSLALQVLKAAHAFAEKRSRLIMPVFLTCNTMRDTAIATLGSGESASSHTLSPEISEGTWSFTDRRLFLELLGKFTNPRVLYRSNEVHDALLDLLTNGSSDTQRLALKAIFTWKHPGLRPYEENLLRLLDDKTFRDELAVLFHADQDESSIEETHRAELLPVLLRVLFGQMVSRSGTHGGQESKRKAILRTLFRLEKPEVSHFLRISFGTLADVRMIQDGAVKAELVSKDLVTVEQQYGLLKTIETMMETLQTQVSPYGNAIVNPVLYCTIRGCRRAGGPTDQTDSPLARSVRKTGIHCLDMLFHYCEEIEWTSLLPLIFEEVIKPRLAVFAIETAQGISSLLRLFSTWSSSLESVSYLQDYESSLLDTIYECLTVASSKDEVKIFVLDQIISPIARLATNDTPNSNHATRILRAHMSTLANCLITFLNAKPGRKVLDAAVDVLSNLSGLVESSEDADLLLVSLILVLKEPAERINPYTKSRLLKSIRDLLSLHRQKISKNTVIQVFQTTTPLFNYFKDVESRVLLSDLMHVFAASEASLTDVANLCAGLNAHSSTRLDEIDFDARLGAFDTLAEVDLTSMTATQYQPVVYNLLYFARTADDLAIRMHAVTCLSRFIEAAGHGTTEGFLDLANAVVLPALRKGIRDRSETVRQDHVALFGKAVQCLPESTQLSDMRVLLVNNDDEASFFNNILHIQSLRRGRAMLRLTKEVEKGTLRSSNICTFFLPLLEKFMFENDGDEAANNMKGQAIVATGVLLGWVEWNQFKAIFRRYKTYMESKSAAEKDTIKLLGVAADALVRATRQADSGAAVSPTDKQQLGRSLASSLPSIDKVAAEISLNLIPVLTTFVHHKDESEMSLRIPVAVIAVKLMKVLPEEQMSQLLPPVLLDLSYILRSRVQDSRDTARRTLSEIAMILGPTCMEYIIKELRTSLARGYQLHVLSYTVNSILKAFGPDLSNGDLDYCLESLVSVIMDDIFGSVGQEKDNEDYVSQMKEVKSNKSFDSMQMLAETASMPHLIKLIQPLRTLLMGKLSSKQSKQVDDLLMRIESGLAINSAARSRELLIFSYEVVQDLYQRKSIAEPRKATNDETNRQRFLIQLSGANKITSASHSRLLYKLAKFALEIVRSTLKKHDNLRTAENMHGFLPVIGDALLQGQDEVKTSAFRLLAAIIDLPVSDMDKNSTLYVIDAVKTIKDSLSTESQIAQAALKFVTGVLRHRKGTEVRESDLSYLLHKITPDLDNPSRQGVTFNFVKAVLARRHVLPEVYEVVDKIGTMMVTDHGREERDKARGVYVHFLLQYPQTNSRWTKQMKFLIKNLDYKHPEGRQSVMEAVNALLGKVGNEKAQEFVDAFFMPVVLLMSNDDDSNCRDMAGALLGHIFRLSNAEKLKSLLTTFRSWLEQSENTTLSRLALQAYKIHLENSAQPSEEDVLFLIEGVQETIQSGTAEEDDSAWESIYHALQLLSSINARYPALTMSPATMDLWSTISQLVSHSHPWVQSTATDLVGAWFADVAKSHRDSDFESIPLTTSYGLILDADSMEHLLRSSVRVLRRNWSNPDLSKQTSVNLTFLGRCFMANEMTIDIRNRPGQQTNDGDKDAEAASNTDSESVAEVEGEEVRRRPACIPATHYLLHQLSSILRIEPARLTTAALLPKQSALELLRALIPHISSEKLVPTLNSVITPLHHLTDSSIPPPKSAAEDFQTAYAALSSSAQELLDEIQTHIGDKEYVRARTEVSKAVRERREGRRTKRRIERVAEPERAARYKKRKGERKVERKKERAVEHRGQRRGW